MTADDELRRLLHDAVDDLEPADRLGQIRRRTASRPPRRPRRALSLAAAVAAPALVIGAVAVVGQLRNDPPTTATRPTTYAAGIYFVGTTPLGPRLYREFQTIDGSADTAERVLSALRRTETSAGPDDPDYTTAWPQGSFVDVAVDVDQVTIELGDAALGSPAGSADLAEVSVQQAVHTADAAVGAPLPVVFTHDGAPATTVLGAAVEARVARLTRVEAPVNISDPAEGTSTDGVLTARGQVTPLATERPARVAWELRRGEQTVLAGTTPVTGVSWQLTLEVPRPPGRHVLRVWAADGRGAPAVDTRTVVLR